MIIFMVFFRNPTINECVMYRQFSVVLKILLDKRAPTAYKYVSQNVPSP